MVPSGMLKLVGALALALLSACSPTGSSVVPTLGAVMSRVDVPRLLDCARQLPDYRSAAACLGAEAATTGLRVALDKALELTERATRASGPAGAGDMTDAERADLGASLDASLDVLAAEIDATHADIAAE